MRTVLHCLESTATAEAPPILRFRGEIDLSTEGQLQAALTAAVQRHSTLVLDLREVTFASVHGLQLVTAAGEGRRRGTTALVGAPGTLRLLGILRFDGEIPCFETIDGACAAVAS